MNFDPTSSATGQRSSAQSIAAKTNGAAAQESGRASSSGDDGAIAPIRAESPRAGILIGPPERRFRLINDLSGRGQAWLARLAPPAPNAGAIEQPVEEFRVLRLFLPGATGSESGQEGEAGLSERSARVDAINWRSTVLKVKTRVETAVKLDHPHIARIYGWWQDPDGWPFVEMEHLDHRNGHSLAQLLRENGRNGFPFAKALEWLRPVAAALDYARREHRIAHQHLSSDTVFVSRDGVVKLLAFGVTAGHEPRSVLFGDDAPAVEAISPAETVAGENVFRQDVFALALLVYQLLTGRSPHEFQTPGAYGPVVPPPPGLTDAAWRVLRRGLAYPSELCPANAGQFLSELEAAQGVAVTGGRSRTPQQRRWWLGAAAAAAAAVVLIGLFSMSRRAPTARPTVDPPTASIAAAGPAPSEQDMQREADARGFASAQRVHTVEAYQLYLQGCPACGHEQEAQAAIVRLQNQAKAEKIKADFEQAVRLLEHEKRGDQGDVALSHLAALAALSPDAPDPLVAAGRQRVVLGWAALAQVSLDRNNLAEARDWLQKAEAIQPKQVELVRLRQALESAQNLQQARLLDNDAFNVARRANTRRAYWTYLERCEPACSHRAETEAALARLAPANPIVKDRLQDGSTGPEMTVIRAGRFVMGSPPQERGRYNDEATHTVQIERPFAIGKYETTFEDYDRFAKATGRTLPNDQGWGRGRRPVINVSWRDAAAYTEWLSQQTNARYRLPTESEWEYAARAGVSSSRYWGDDPNQGCDYVNAADLDGKRVFVGWNAMDCRDGYVYTAPVGSRYDNNFGLFDMLGNVLEWTCSLYDKDASAPVQSCQEPAEDRQFVVRGGSWSDEPRNVRLADRHRSRPEFQDYFLGFRLVREMP